MDYGEVFGMIVRAARRLLKAWNVSSFFGRC
jgi:hypothetical protein